MNRLDYVFFSLRRAAENGYSWSVSPDEAGALVAEVERLRADLDALTRAIGQAVVASSLATGETLADPIPHIIVSTVTRLRAEALGQRADNAEIGALAYADGAEAERAAVVAWLRREVDNDDNAEGPLACILAYASNAIERGEHRREERE